MKFVVLVHIVLLALAVPCESGCFAVNPGSIADVCSQLQDKLQLAVVRNPTNIYLIKKVWSDPIPSIVHVQYKVDISNTSTASCAVENNTEFESVNTSTVFSDALWTDRGIFTLFHPGILQQLQLQLPYMILVEISNFFADTDNPFGSFVLSAILWNGCESSTVRGLPSITLSLQVDNLPCIPSQLQLETSLVELTSWLQAFATVQPQNEQPDLDIEKRWFALSSNFTIRSLFQILEIIAFPFYICIALIVSYIIIKLLFWSKDNEQYKALWEIKNEKYKGIVERVFTPIVLIVSTWNILILSADIYSFVECPPSVHNIQLFNIMLFSTTSFMLPLVFAFCLCFYKRKCFGIDSDIEKLKKIVSPESTPKVFLLYVFALWNIFMFVAYFYTSALAALLLAYAYPFEVLAVSSFLLMSVTFNTLLFSIISPSVYDNLNKINPTLASVIQELIILVVHVVTVLVMNTVVLSIFGVAILKGLVSLTGITGKIMSLIPSIILGVISVLLEKYLLFITNKESTENRLPPTPPTPLTENRSPSTEADSSLTVTEGSSTVTEGSPTETEGSSTVAESSFIIGNSTTHQDCSQDSSMAATTESITPSKAQKDKEVVSGRSSTTKIDIDPTTDSAPLMHGHI